MHQQIRIAADRAGEVRVGLIRQAKVPAVGQRIDRLLHGAQQHAVDLSGIRPVFGGLGNRLKSPRPRVIRQRYMHCKRPQVATQDFKFFRRRPFMHTVQAGALMLAHEIGSADVGRQHGLLDQPMGLGAGAWHDLLDTTVVVANDLRLGRLEIHCAAGAARGQQRAVHLMQVEQILHPIRKTAGFGAAGIGEHGSHFGIGQACMAFDDGRVELIAVNLALGGDDHVAHHCQARHLRIQRAQAVGELFRQHGQYAARKIHTGGAIIGVGIDRTARLHVAAHIGNGHQQAPGLGTADACGLTVHRIIKIARIFTVDGDKGHVGQVHPLAPVLRAHRIGQRLRLRQAGIGEYMRHVVLAHRDFNLHARIIHFAQHLHHTPNGLAVERGRLGQLHYDDLPHDSSARCRPRDEHVLPIALVLGCHQPDAGLIEQAPDDGLGRPFDDFQHAPFRTPAPVLAHDAHAHSILVQRCAHFIGRQINIAFAVVTDHKAMSVTVALHAAFNFVVGGCANFVFFAIQSCSFLKCPGGGIGRRTSFRY